MASLDQFTRDVEQFSKLLNSVNTVADACKEGLHKKQIIEAQDQKIENNDKAIADLDKTIQEKQKLIEEKNDEAAQIEAQAQEGRNQILANAKVEAEKDLNAIAKQVQDAQDQLNNIKGDIDTNTATLAGINKELEAKQAELSKVKAGAAAIAGG